MPKNINTHDISHEVLHHAHHAGHMLQHHAPLMRKVLRQELKRLHKTRALPIKPQGGSATSYGIGAGAGVLVAAAAFFIAGRIRAARIAKASDRSDGPAAS